MRPVQITPEPSEAEREAILAALVAEEVEQRRVSGWAAGAVPERGGGESEP